MIQGPDVGVCEIVHVNVVTDAGTVGCGIIGAVDKQFWELSLGCFQSPGDEVGGFLVSLADAAFRVRPGNIEIAQGDVAEVVSPGHVPQDGLHHDLGGPVRVDGIEGDHLVHGHPFRDAIDGGSRGVNEVSDTLLHHGFQQIDRVDDIIAVVFQGLPNGFLHLDGGGKVHNGLGPEGGQDIVQVDRIGQFACDKSAIEDGPFMAGGQIVVDEQLVARFAQGLYDVAADVPGTTGNEDFHV